MKFLDIINPMRWASRPAAVGDERWWSNDVMPLVPESATSADAAAKNDAVNFCISIIAETAGSLPLEWIDTATGEVTSDFEFGNQLADAPNPLQTGAEFWASMAYSAALRGRAFAEPVSTGEGMEVWPLNPLRLTEEWDDRSFRLTYADDGGNTRTLGPADVFWMAGLSDATMRPLTPWKMAKGAIDFAFALQNQGRTFFREGKRLAGVLQTDTKLPPEAAERVRVSMREWKSGQTPVLEQGLKYSAVSSNNADSQLQELIRQRTLELARYWRIPRSMIGEEGVGAANAEQEALGFTRNVIRPIVRRNEQAIRQRLLTPDQRKKYKPKFNIDGLLRGDSATQWRNAVLARTASIMSRNQIAKHWFGLPEIDEPWANDPREPLASNRPADTMSGGMTAPQDREDA